MATDNDEQQESNAFEQAKADARAEYVGMDLKALAFKMKEVQEARDVLKSRLARANAHLDVLRFECIPSKMDETGVEKISYDGLGRVSLTADLQVSVKDKQGFFGWLKKNKLGDLIQPAVNSSTLKSWLKGRIKDGKKYPTDMLNINPVTRASITKG